MSKQLMIVIVVGALCGIAVELARGDRVGAGIGVFVAVVGTTMVVLMRNQRDLAELQHGQAPGQRAR